MTLNWFANVLVHHPCMVLISITVFSGTCLIIPLSLKIYPNFSDPQMGFETRGTYLANKQTAWKNLVEASQSSGPFVLNPKELFLKQNLTNSFKFNKKKKSKKKNNYSKKSKPKILLVESNTTREDNNNWILLQNLMNAKTGEVDFNSFRRLHKEGFFCGSPDEDYVQMVVKAIGDTDLFNLESLLVLCKIEHEFMQTKFYKELCVVTSKTKQCCRPWSLGNYIALLENRSSCLAITEEDVNKTKALLQKCSQYYHNFQLAADCSIKGHCEAPLRCIHYDAVFNIFNFLTSTSFIPPNQTSQTELKETMIFLPLACSTATLPYYHELEKLELVYDNISVAAMELGIKSALFDEYLIRDTWLMMSGAIFIIICMWLYTKSLFLTMMTIIVIIFSLGISYFMYTLVFELRFFPFMNLLATVVAIGIGADDTFIFCKIWLITKSKNSDSSLVKIMSDTIHHAYSSMFITSATTAAAFFASYLSSITAVRCFSIFASMAVVANCFLMMSWFPASIVLWERCHRKKCSLPQGRFRLCVQRICCLYYCNFVLASLRMKIDYFYILYEKKQHLLLDLIINLRYLWYTLFSLLACGSALVVFYYPKLQLPNSPEFQLFHSMHPFEQYDLKYKNLFWFKRSQMNLESSGYYKLPLRFIWGILPVDNGNFLDPQALGTIELDPLFDMSHPESQKWLLQFCQNLRNQSFYQPTLGPLLPNCFIESFTDWMQRRCLDTIEHIDRSPCCETETFPYNSSVFNLCIVEAIADLYATPSDYFIPGMAGPKFSKANSPLINAVVVEYDSRFSHSMSYEYMRNFVDQVETWMANELKTAPETMQGGWFTSDLSVYDLQQVLSNSTIAAICVSMALALAVLLLSTLNVLISLYAIITITFSILVTMAVLVLLGWKLNILESIALSTAIGLSVDFSLHYAVHYRLCSGVVAEDRQRATRFALKKMMGPSSMAAITTGAAGAFMIPSLILPYIQIGIFLVTIMSVSWFYATFHLGSILAILGPQRQFGQFKYSHILFCCQTAEKCRHKDSGRSVPESSRASDVHELESLTNKSSGNSEIAHRHLERSYSLGKNNVGRNLSDQSPSATSAVTIVMADEN